MVGEVEHAGFLAEGGTNAARELGEVVRCIEQAIGCLPFATAERVVPLGRFVAQRAGPVAEGHAAVHAAASLLFAVVAVERLFHFAKVVDALVYRSVAGFQARHF